MKLKPEARFWDVRFSRPETIKYKQPDGSVKEHTREVNFHLMVAAETIAMAVFLVREEYPDSNIWQVNNHGQKSGIIVQPDLIIGGEGK